MMGACFVSFPVVLENNVLQLSRFEQDMLMFIFKCVNKYFVKKKHLIDIKYYCTHVTKMKIPLRQNQLIQNPTSLVLNQSGFLLKIFYSYHCKKTLENLHNLFPGNLS
jgi:hypothetical protein